MPLLLALLLACSTDPEPLTCAEGELLDGDLCVPEVCGTGTWGDLETDGYTIYVDASADAGGDGGHFDECSDCVECASIGHDDATAAAARCQAGAALIEKQEDTLAALQAMQGAAAVPMSRLDEACRRRQCPA